MNFDDKFQLEASLAGVFAFASLLVSAHLGALSDSGLDSDAAGYLIEHDLTPTEVGGYAWFECGRYEPFATKFEAVNASGQQIDGAVCKNMFTGDPRIISD